MFFSIYSGTDAVPLYYVIADVLCNGLNVMFCVDVFARVIFSSSACLYGSLVLRPVSRLVIEPWQDDLLIMVTMSPMTHQTCVINGFTQQT